MISPQPRFRIYTKPKQYGKVISKLITNTKNKGNDLEILTQNMKNLLNVKYVIPMPTARFAIYMSVKNTIKPGQRVILSPLTISDVINMVICAGGIPVFADVDRETCNISYHSISKLIDDNTGAVLITHLHGLACDIHEIKKLCQSRNIPLIEDSAQAFTAVSKGNYCGTIGDIGIYSFGMYKNVNSFFGGLLVTNNESVYNLINTQLSVLPFFNTKIFLSKFFSAFLTDIATAPLVFPFLTFKLFRYAFINNVKVINDKVVVDKHPVLKHTLPSHYMCRMTPMQASLILSQLDEASAMTQKRIKSAKIYHIGLSDISELSLPPLCEDGSHIYTYFPIQFKNRRDLLSYGLKNNRDWVLSHYHNCANLQIFSDYYQDCPNASLVSSSLLYLPTYPRYKTTEILKNINVIRKYFGKNELLMMDIENVLK